MSKVRFAVVGCGHIGKRHATLLSALAEVELVALCDIQSKEKLGLTEAHATLPFYMDLVQMLSQVKTDVLCVCTPNGLHAQHAIAGLQAGAHIVLEKPMALSKADGESIIFHALKVQRQVFCVMQNRYSPPAVWLKSVVESGVLGDIRIVDTRCYWNRDSRYYRPNGTPHTWKGKLDLDGGVLFTQFSHFVDMIYWLFGDIKDIQARQMRLQAQENVDFDDSGLVSFAFISGGFGQLSYTTAVWDANLESSITIIGSKGTIQVGGQYMDKVMYCHINNYTMPELAETAPPNDYGNYKGSAANHHFVFENVLAVLSGKATTSTNALEGLKVVDIIERIQSAS